jgi:hypothetical protein
MTNRIATADEIAIGKYPDTIVYREVLDKEYYYVECTRTGRKRLAMKTFYKTRTAPEEDAVLFFTIVSANSCCCELYITPKSAVLNK